jgi:hypothetical protein
MRPRGIVRLYESGRLLWEETNLFVNTGLPLLANLIAGITTNQYVTAIGFGSSATPPSVSDTGLGGTPAYYKAIGASSFPSPGSVQFDYSLATTDYGAIGITIQELGLFANSAPVALPSAIGSANPPWTASSAEAVGNLMIDSNNNIQYCTTAGTTGSTAPPWATTLGSTTSDNGVVWTLVAFNNVPVPLVAHVTVPAFAYTGTGNYEGTWTLTF